jgi:hypothetical protein
MKKTIIGLLAAVSIIGGLTTVADAKVSIYFGVPYYDYQYGPDYRYYDGRGWYQYQPNYWYQYQPRYRGRLSCNEARRIVRQNGFRNVVTRECQGRTYTFTATRRGHQILVFVNSRTGAVWRG